MTDDDGIELRGSTPHRQWHQLDDGEVADLADAVVRSLAVELRNLHVAGGDMSYTWELANQIRDTITEHHRNVVVRSRGGAGWPATQLTGQIR